jgi:hypothetical protein
VGKEHGRFEKRCHTVPHVVDWYGSERSYPGAPRFPKLSTIGMIDRADKIETERRCYISSRAFRVEITSTLLARANEMIE